MEHKTSFDLNRAIDDWRAKLIAQESVPPNDLRELESHLRESISQWTARGAAEEEAFYLASRRIGPPKQIAAEFEKEDPLNPWRMRLFWMLIGIMSLRFITDFAGAIGAILSTLALELGIGTETILQELASNDPFELFSSVQLAIIALAPLALYMISKRFHSPKGRPWKRVFAWLGASKTRLIFATAVLLIAATVADWLSAGWRAEVIRTDILSLTDLQGVIEFAPPKSPNLWTSIPYPLILILLLATVAPGSSGNRPGIREQ